MRARGFAFRTAALMGAVLAVGCMAPLFEPLEEPLIFRPRPLDEAEARALAHASRVEEVRVATAGGITLHGWLKRPDDWRPGRAHPLVIIYAGVGQEVSELVRLAHASGHWGWLMINYRGFGLSGGSPSERAVIGDAKRIYDWAAARPDIDTANIVVLGKSLGTYVAVSVAASRKVRAAILATPFDSVAALIRQYGLPFGWLIQERYNPSLLAPSVAVPALFVLAENDGVTPVKNGLALASVWGGKTKTVMLAGAGHSGIEARDEFWRSVDDFLAAMDLSSPPAPQAARATGSATSAAAAAPSTNR
jgi:pimeloyl-ACP methyl ester carboxylesterase